MNAAKDLLDVAVSAWGLDDFGDDSFREGLEIRALRRRPWSQKPYGRCSPKTRHASPTTKPPSARAIYRGT